MKKLSKKQLLARKKLKLIRPYVSFDYDLRKKLAPSQIRKVNRYHETVKSILKLQGSTFNNTNNSHIYRPKTKKHLKAAQEFYQIDEFKDIKAIPIAKVGGKKPRVRFNKKGKISVRDENVTRVFHPFNLDESFTNSQILDQVQFVLDAIPDNARLQLAVGGQGERLIAGTGDKKFIYKRVEELLNIGMYGDDVKLWLTGVVEYKFTNQKSFDDYRRSKSRNRAELKKRGRKKKKVTPNGNSRTRRRN